MKLPSEKKAKYIVLLSFFIFLPIFFWVGVGAGIIPVSLLSIMVIFSILSSPFFGVILLLQAIFYLVLEYGMASLSVKLIYRFSGTTQRWVLLIVLTSLPLIASLLPIYGMAGLQGGTEPANIFEIFSG